MRHSRNLVFLLVVTLLPTMTSADAEQPVPSVTGNSLLEYCGSKNVGEYGVCVGYITGVGDIETMDGAAFPDRQRFCTPDNATNGQIIDIVVKYLKDHPAARHLLGAILVVNALTEAFPCSSK